MYILSLNPLSTKRLRSTGIYTDIWTAEEWEHPPGVEGYLRKRGISVNGAKAQQVKGGMVKGEEDGEDVIVACEERGIDQW
jgi:hypothetical protein